MDRTASMRHKGLNRKKHRGSTSTPYHDRCASFQRKQKDWRRSRQILRNIEHRYSALLLEQSKLDSTVKGFPRNNDSTSIAERDTQRQKKRLAVLKDHVPARSSDPSDAEAPRAEAAQQVSTIFELPVDSSVEKQRAPVPAKLAVTFNGVTQGPDLPLRNTVQGRSEASHPQRAPSVTKVVKANDPSPMSLDRSPAYAQRGMPNVTGVACYRNSLMQALLHVPCIRQWLLRKPWSCTLRQKDNCVSCNLNAIFEKYWRQPGGDLNQLLRRTQYIYQSKRWDRNHAQQQDPQEQFLWIQNQMEKEMPPPSYRAWKDLSHLWLDSVITCRNCGHRSKTSHLEGSLSIPIKPRGPNDDLHGLLRRFLIERLDYKCEQCNVCAQNVRKQTIRVSPACLVIQLKRFDFQGHKDNSDVPFSTTLDLSPFTSPNNVNATASVYDLCAAVSHSGTLRFGHYVCLAKGPDGKWNRYDDRSMTLSREDAVRGSRGGHGFTPYLLFYQRRV